MHTPGDDASAFDAEDSRVEVYVTTDTSAAPHKADEAKLYVMYDAAHPDGDKLYVTTDTSAAPHKADEAKLYVMYDAAHPDGDKLYFTEAEWDAFVLGVKDGEFDLDESGNLP